MPRWDELQSELRSGMIGRRGFLAGAAALGASGAVSSTALAQAAKQTPKRGGHLVLGIDGASAADNLDPTLPDTDYTAICKTQLYDSLSYVDGAGVHPALAESWSTEPGAKMWIFKLRKGVTFHNGKSLTAADVVHSVNHHREKDSRSALRAMAGTIEDVKETAPNEVTITLKSGDADMPFLVGAWQLGIVPEGTKFTDGVGTGPFSLESFEPGVRMRAKRNESDWRTDRGFVDSVETIAINDPMARLSALASGSAHVINKVTPATVAAMEKNSQIQLLNISGAAHAFFAMMCDTPPFDDADLRIAMKYALDRQAIIKTVFRGYAEIGNDQPIPSFNSFYAANIPQRPYDSDKAKYYFKKSRHSGPIVLYVADVAYPGAIDTAVIYRDSASKAGIDIQINRVPNDGYFDQIQSKVPFFANFNSGRPTPGALFSYGYLSSSPNNQTHWKQPQFDDLVIQARTELDPAKRKQLYHDAQLIIHDDGGSIVFAFVNLIDAGSSALGGFNPDPSRNLSGMRVAEKVWFL